MSVPLNIGFYEVGSVIQIPVNFIKSNGDGIATNVVVDVTYPAGLTYQSAALDAGTYDDGTKRWTIGSVLKTDSIGAVFDFVVADDCPLSFQIDFVVSSLTGCESCLTDNTYCIIASGTSCCASRRCSDPAIETITDDEVADGSIDMYLIDASSNTVDLTLPTASAVFNTNTSKGQVFTVKALDATSAITVAPPSGNIIDETGTPVASKALLLGESVQLVSDGTDYILISFTT